MTNDPNVISRKKIRQSFIIIRTIFCRHVTRGGRGREVSPALFRNLGKSVIIFKKNPDCGHCGHWFLLKVQFLRVSRRKTWAWAFEDLGLSFSCCRWLFIEAYWFQEKFRALKTSWLRACFDVCYFLGSSITLNWQP